MDNSVPMLQCADKTLSLDTPRVMGILNVTPDSFSDGGRYIQLDTALAQVASMLSAGADIIDVGGGSTRPGAAAVDIQEEIERVVPVIEAIRQRFDTIVSIDSSKPAVFQAACAAGAGMINDVRALRETGAVEMAAGLGVPVCLMHMQGEPRTMQQSPDYTNVVNEVLEFLLHRRSVCVAAGIVEQQILLDPGFGFGKSFAHNLSLLGQLERFCEHAAVLTGLSRKRMIGAILGDDSADRTTASVTAALLCVQRGASIVRVHDVEPTVQALAVHNAVANAEAFAGN